MNDSDSPEYDLIIVGGGLAGASLAVALMSQLAAAATAKTAGDAGRKYRVAVVEAYAPDDDLQPSYDDRSIALSWGSRLIYQQIGVWPVLAPHAEAIKNIHISDRGHFGVTRLSAEQEGVEALGYVVENRPVGAELFRLMSEAQDAQDDPAVHLDLYCPAQLAALSQHDDRVSIELNLPGERQSGQAAGQVPGQEPGQAPATISLQADMLVAADGNNSRVLKLLNIGSSRQDYKQSAVISNITPGRVHANVAYERFTETGPLAMLPMRDNRCSVVWTLPPDEAARLCAMDEEAFRQSLQQAFGFRLGEIRKLGKRAVYPLFLQSASEMVHGRVAILGNAAHSVHPVAGQGFNLALRDVALLTDLIDRDWRQQAATGDGINVRQILDDYARLRSEDIQQVYRFTDTLVKLFSNAISPLAHARSCGLLLVDLLPDIKHTLAAHSMGMSGANLRDLRLLRNAAHGSWRTRP